LPGKNASGLRVAQMMMQENYRLNHEALLLLSNEFKISNIWHAPLWSLVVKQAEVHDFCPELWVNEHGYLAITDFYDCLFSQLLHFDQSGPLAGQVYQWVLSLILDSFLHIRKDAISLLESSSQTDLTRLERAAIVFLYVLRLAYPRNMVTGRFEFIFEGFHQPSLSEIKRFTSVCEHLSILDKPPTVQGQIIDAMLDYGMRIADSAYGENGNFPETYNKFSKFVVSMCHLNRPVKPFTNER